MLLDSGVAHECYTKHVDASKAVWIDLSGELNSGEILSAPTLVEMETADLMISAVSVSSTALTINGTIVAAGQAITALVAGGAVAASETEHLYTLRAQATSNAAPNQVVLLDIQLEVIP